MSREDPKYTMEGEIDGRSIRDLSTRPEKPIDWQKVDELLIAGCLGTEIAACFDMHPTTFYNRVEKKYGMSFTNYSSEKRYHGDSILRAKQFDTAINGNVTMQIWLGKNRLNQKDGDHSTAHVNAEQLAALAACLERFSQKGKTSSNTEGAEDRNESRSEPKRDQEDAPSP